MVTKVNKKGNVTDIFLIVSLVAFNLLNFFDKITTYVAMNLGGFVEMNSRAVYFFNTLGVPTAITIRFLIASFFSLLIFIVTFKFLKFIYLRIPVIMGYLYVTINYLIAVISNNYYLVVR